MSYRHPASYRPPLAFGGHEFTMGEVVTTCPLCGGVTPTWAIYEGLWMTFVARWCPAKVAALPGPPSRELPGQLTIYHALADA